MYSKRLHGSRISIVPDTSNATFADSLLLSIAPAGHSQWGSPNAVNGRGCGASVLSQVDSRQGFDHPIHFFCMTMHERNTRLCRRSLRHTSHMSLAWRLQSNCSHHTPVAVTHSFDRYQSRAQAFDMGTCRRCFILLEFARFSLVRRKTSARRKFPHL